MAQVINTNLASLGAQRALNASQADVNTALQRLSSGLRINTAKDDAAGLAISQRMTAQINGLNQAARNAADATSLSQTAEGALSEVTANLQRIRELAVQSANATNSSQDRTALQAEVTQLMAEIDRVSNQTKFNGVNLLNGTFTSQNFQVGANASETVAIASIASSRTSDLGSYNGLVESNVTYTANDAANAKNVNFSATGATSLGAVADDAKAISSALNASGLGFSATAGITSLAGTASDVLNTIAGQNDTFVVNGVSITLTQTVNAATNRTHAVSQINAQTASTGVIATDDGSKVNLTAADGRNITVGYTKGGGNSTEQAYGLTTNDVAGTTSTTGATLSVTLKSSNTGNVRLNGVQAGAGGFANAAAGLGTVGSALSTNDITTASNASTMINAVDAALDSVNTSRADLGALQNRFDSIVNSVLIASENQSAARSRIVDADFAQETASLTRGQILQQAGVAVLAQANAAPQNVLALLQ